MTYTEERTLLERADIVCLLKFQSNKHTALTRRSLPMMASRSSFPEYQHASAFQPDPDRTTDL